MKKLICMLCFVIGMGIIFYPHLQEMESERKQQDLLENLSATATTETVVIETEVFVDRQDLEADKKWLREYELINAEALKAQQDLESKTSTESKVIEKKSSASPKAVGAITIGKIDLELPLLKGATNENLKVAPSIMRESSDFGDVGNISIAGHRSYTYGKQFNRLDEIELGDEIEITDGNKNYVYTVNNKIVVEPDELWVLEGNGKDKMVTLITCTPIRVATHRLIIQGVLKE